MMKLPVSQFHFFPCDEAGERIRHISTIRAFELKISSWKNLKACSAAGWILFSTNVMELPVSLFVLRYNRTFLR